MKLYFTFSNWETYTIDLIDLAYMKVLENDYDDSDMYPQDAIISAREIYNEWCINTSKAIEFANSIHWIHIFKIAYKMTNGNFSMNSEWRRLEKKVV